MSEKTKALILAALAGVMCAVLIFTFRWYLHLNDRVVTDEAIEGNLEKLENMGEPETTPPPEPIHVLPSEDAILLAKIMAAEDGLDWPDWAIMAIGEVVLNRVESPEFPGTIRGVLYQTNPIQYAPVQDSSFEEAAATPRYIELAERLLDGERVLCDKDIVYQALFEQGSVTVMSYYDEALETTTYFCKG